MSKYIRLYSALFVIAIILIPSALQAFQRVDKIDSVLTALYEAGDFNGTFLLAKGEEIIYKKAFGKANFEWNIPHTINTRFKIASITKSFTATLVLCLAEKGLLSLDDVINDHLPSYPSSTGQKITIEHLLAQSSGIPDYLNMPDFWNSVALREHNPHEFIRYFYDLELEFEPGTDWNYGNSSYYLLGLIIEEATGMTYEEAMQKFVLGPMNLENTGYAASHEIIKRLATGYEKTPEGYELAPFFHSSIGFSAGMMYSTVEDLFKWSRQLYKDKFFKDPQYLEKMISPHHEIYGYGVFIGELRRGDNMERMIVHLGRMQGFSSQLTLFWDTDYTLSILDNTQHTAPVYFAIRDVLF